MKTGTFTKDQVSADVQLSKLVKCEHNSYPNGSNYYQYALANFADESGSLHRGFLWEGPIVKQVVVDSKPGLFSDIKTVGTIRAGDCYRVSLKITERGPGADFGPHFYNRDDLDFTLAIEPADKPRWFTEFDD